jgi:hypothetical protein
MMELLHAPASDRSPTHTHTLSPPLTQAWRRQASGSWHSDGRADIRIHIAPAASRESGRYMTFSELLAALNLPLAMQLSSRYLYGCRLISEVFRNCVTRAGATISGSALKCLLDAVEHAYILSHTTGRLHHQALMLMLRAAEDSLQSCSPRTGIIANGLNRVRRIQEDRALVIYVGQTHAESPLGSRSLMDLPEDVLYLVARSLADHTDLMSLACTCKEFARICADNTLWKNLCRRNIPRPVLATYAGNLWKEVYLSALE